MAKNGCTSRSGPHPPLRPAKGIERVLRDYYAGRLGDADLEAGCSKDCGHHLGPEMKDDLERFGRSLDPATSPRLLKAVKDTVDLMVGTTDTVDILVQKLYGGHLDSRIGRRLDN